jgi:hypothetical protein
VEFKQDVPARTPNAGLHTLVVENGRSDAHRFFGIENGRQQLIVHLQAAASLLSSPSTVRHHGGHALTDVTDHIVQNVRVIGIGVIIVVIGRCKQQPRDILPREDRVDAGHRQCAVLANGQNPRVCVRRPEQFQVQQPVDMRVESIPRLSCDDC